LHSSGSYNVIGELIKINASRELKHSYTYHLKPCKRLNWLNRFIPDYLRNLTVKTFTGLLNGNYDLVLLLPVMNFEDKLMEDYLLKAGSIFCFQDDALYFMQNYTKP